MKKTCTLTHDEIVRLYKAGLTLQAIGTKAGVTRERIRQILVKRGVVRAEGGQSVQKTAAMTARTAARDARYLSKYGCTFAEYRQIRIGGGTRPYAYHKKSAEYRCIPFNLTIKQWWDFWQTSGKWDLRGRSGDSYVMARLNDSGAYEVGNIYIITLAENSSEWARKRIANGRPKAAYTGCYHQYPGRAKGWIAKAKGKSIGLFYSPEEAVAARAAFFATQQVAV